MNHEPQSLVFVDLKLDEVVSAAERRQLQRSLRSS